MSQGEIKGLENAFSVRMIDIDTKEEVVFKSLAAANRKTGIKQQTIKEGLNPLNKKRFKHEGKTVVFRVLK